MGLKLSEKKEKRTPAKFIIFPVKEVESDPDDLKAWIYDVLGEPFNTPYIINEEEFWDCVYRHRFEIYNDSTARLFLRAGFIDRKFLLPFKDIFQITVMPLNFYKEIMKDFQDIYNQY